MNRTAHSAASTTTVASASAATTASPAAASVIGGGGRLRDAGPLKVQLHIRLKGTDVGHAQTLQRIHHTAAVHHVRVGAITVGVVSICIGLLVVVAAHLHLLQA